MKAYLLYPDRDLDLNSNLSWNAQTLIEDLELDTLIKAMSAGDAFVFDIARRVILTSIANPLEIILYRQDILKDCLKFPDTIMAIYQIAVETIESEKKIYWGIFSKYPSSILDRSINVIQMYVSALKKLRKIAEDQTSQFQSKGFTTFFEMLIGELSDAYFEIIQDHLKELKFHNGVWISVKLGKGVKGTQYVLRKPVLPNQSWFERIFSAKPPVYSYTIADRDEAGARALTDLKDRGINAVANALAQSCNHILNFFKMLQTELAFYIGCMNLHRQLTQLGEPIAFPHPVEVENRVHTFKGLYDVCLSLTINQKVVGNDLHAVNKNLFIITGANQGGKSTFLRSIGLAQLMMHSGMYVPAESFSANLCDNLFTHYKREEDTTMTSGKLEEELSRMNDIVNHITPNSLLLFNESFAATNEREGSEIARQITNAIIEDHAKVFFVSHLYDFTHSFFVKKKENMVFLRAEREEDGRRTYKLVEGEPLLTSFGKDLYHKIAHKEYPAS